MSLWDKLKGKLNWQNVVVIAVFLGCITAIILVGSKLEDLTVRTLMVGGGLIALGIPTSLVGNMTTSATNPKPPEEANTEELEKDIDDLRISIANVLNEVLTLKNRIGENNHE